MMSAERESRSSETDCSESFARNRDSREASGGANSAVKSRVPLRLLIIEDLETDAEELTLELESAGLLVVCTRVDDDADLLSELEKPWDAVLCDYVVPGMNWQRSLEVVRRADELVPFIVVSGQRGEEFAVETMRGGASDYIVKSRLMRLAPALQREMESAAETRRGRDIQRRLEKELQSTRRFEATGRLAGGLSHNLNNLLTVIMGGLDIARLNESLGEDGRYVEEAARAVETAAKMVRQLASLGQEPTYEPDAVNLSSVVSQVEALIRPILPKGVNLQTKCQHNLPIIIADQAQLEQALLNLVLNARDSVDGSGTISLFVSKRDSDEIVFRVDDDGVGIAEELHERIFEPYYSTKGEGGSGIGLASAYYMARSHGGGISVSSRPGNGSSFELAFPLKISDPERERGTSQEWQRGEGRILVVDDAEDGLLTTRAILERCGYTVSTMSRYADAVENLSSSANLPNLVIVDAVVTGGGARELLAWTRRRSLKIPLVLTSGFEAERYDRYRLYEGFSAFVQKPFRAREFSLIVARVMAEAEGK